VCVVIVILLLVRRRRSRTVVAQQVPLMTPPAKVRKFKSVKDVGLSFDQNPAHRKTMEVSE
jgi:hypothetical protein